MFLLEACSDSTLYHRAVHQFSAELMAVVDEAVAKIRATVRRHRRYSSLSNGHTARCPCD